MRIKPKQSGTGLAVAIVLFVIVNLSVDHPHCWDCFAKVGFPFHYLNHGGFAGGGGYIRSGIAKDAAVVLIVAILIGYLLSLIPSKHKNQ
jgi:hypothetical protein